MDSDSKGAAAVEVDNVLVISNNITASELWSGIGGHFDNYSQILCEFIDNSISNFLGNLLGLNQVIIDIRRLRIRGMTIGEFSRELKKTCWPISINVFRLHLKLVSMRPK